MQWLLLSVLSISQAVAKLRFADDVVRSDIDAAIALMRASQASIEPELQKRTREDPVSRLYMVRALLVLLLLIYMISICCPEMRVDRCCSCSFVQLGRYRCDAVLREHW
jgi:hypothetical protein